MGFRGVLYDYPLDVYPYFLKIHISFKDGDVSITSVTKVSRHFLTASPKPQASGVAHRCQYTAARTMPTYNRFGSILQRVRRPGLGRTRRSKSLGTCADTEEHRVASL